MHFPIDILIYGQYIEIQITKNRLFVQSQAVLRHDLRVKPARSYVNIELLQHSGFCIHQIFYILCVLNSRIFLAMSSKDLLHVF